MGQNTLGDHMHIQSIRIIDYSDYWLLLIGVIADSLARAVKISDDVTAGTVYYIRSG